MGQTLKRVQGDVSDDRNKTPPKNHLTLYLNPIAVKSPQRGTSEDLQQKAGLQLQMFAAISFSNDLIYWLS